MRKIADYDATDISQDYAAARTLMDERVGVWAAPRAALLTAVSRSMMILTL
jgi:hypothetical protein